MGWGLEGWEGGYIGQDTVLNGVGYLVGEMGTENEK